MLLYAQRVEKTELGIEIYCQRCGEYWPEDFFAKQPNGRAQTYCRGCFAEYQRERRRGNLAEARKRRAAYERRQRECREKQLCIDCRAPRPVNRVRCERCAKRAAEVCSQSRLQRSY